MGVWNTSNQNPNKHQDDKVQSEKFNKFRSAKSSLVSGKFDLMLRYKDKLPPVQYNANIRTQRI